MDFMHDDPSSFCGVMPAEVVIDNKPVLVVGDDWMYEEDKIRVVMDNGDHYVSSDSYSEDQYSSSTTLNGGSNDVMSNEENMSEADGSEQMKMEKRFVRIQHSSSLSDGMLSSEHGDMLSAGHGNKDLSVKTERRLIIVRPGADPDEETKRAINQITEELDRKAAEELSSGRVPAAETVIEITRVVSSKADSVKPVLMLNNVDCLDNFEVDHCENLLQSSSASEHIQVPSDSGVKGTFNTVYKRPGITFRIDEFRTPSPLLPFWDRRPTSTSPVLDQPCDDFYFRSSPQTVTPDPGASSSTVCLGNRIRIGPGLTVVNNYHKSSPEPQNICFSKVFTPIDQLANIEGNSSFSSNNSKVVFTTKDTRSCDLIGSHDCVLTTQVTRNKHERHKKRPPYSYMQLIQMAIGNSPDMRLTLREIYQWIENQFPYYKYHSHQGWKNSIRHNLSLYDIFVRVKSMSASRTTTSYWTLRNRGDVSLLKSRFQSDAKLRNSPANDDDTEVRRAGTSTSEVHGSLRTNSNDIINMAQKRKGPVPLLPKPSTQMQTFTLVPVTPRFSTVQLVAAKPSTDIEPQPRACWNQPPVENTTKVRTLPQASVSKTILKRNAAVESQQNPNHPLKLKVMSRSLSQPAASHNIAEYSQVLSNSNADSILSHKSEDDVCLLTAGLDTSTLRQQFSNLQFDSHESRTAEHVKSASDIVLLRSNADGTRVAVDGAQSRPVVHKHHRRKQAFNQLLQTPPDNRHHRVPSDDQSDLSVSSSSQMQLESGVSALDSGFASFVDRPVCPQTPPSQIRVRSPLRGSSGDDNNEEDMTEMLFTPFKTDIVGGMLCDLSPDIDLSSSVVAGSDSWISFTPATVGPSARTSTPCRMLESTPKANRNNDRHCHASPRFSRLLREFEDDGLLPLGCFSLNGVNDQSQTDLTSSGAFLLENAVGLDISELNFSPLR